MSLPIPSRVGAFAVERELGRGGMGVVYLASDSRLDRKAAIKALPADLAADPDRLARFQREARVLASLSHPNIATVYGLEHDKDQSFLVMEFIDGETLAARLRRAPLPVDEAVDLASQIAAALEAAHEKGIVHRDLKPANVMLTPDGNAKVLDFGLARAAEDPAPSSSDLSNSPTMTSPPPVHSPTIPGIILGTAGYMSPEQARGKPVDKRSDIFSFGCVLFEMLAGAQAFQGETATDIIGAVLHVDPDWSRLPAATPARIRDLLRACLSRDRKGRLRDMGDARLELERVIAGHEPVAPVTRPRASPAALALATGVGAALLGAGWLLAARFADGRAAPARPLRLDIPSSTGAYRGAGGAVISPNGRTVVFDARTADGSTTCLWVRPLDSFDAKPLPETTNANSPFWSWDSRALAFHEGGKLWSVDVEHPGSRRLLAAEPTNGGASWGPSGDILLARSEGSGSSVLIRIPPGGGTPVPVTALDAAAFEKQHGYPTFLPDGNHFLFLAVTMNPDEEVRSTVLYAGRLDSPERMRIGKIPSHAWYVEPGRLAYVEDGTIKAVNFDPASLRITGEPVTIADGAEYFRPTGWTSVSVAANGTILFGEPQPDSRLVWSDLTGARQGTLGPAAELGTARISPDGTTVVAGVFDRRTGLSDLWLYGVDRPTATRLTTDPRWEESPVWSHDGSTVYFSSDRTDTPEIYSIPADGSAPMTRVFGPGSGGHVWFAADASPDGASLLAVGSFEKLGQEIRIISLDNARTQTAFRSSPANEYEPRFAPSGSWIAFVSDESGVAEVYVAPYPGPGPKVQVSAGGNRPRWAPDGTRLYYLRRAGGTTADPAAPGYHAVMVVDLPDPAAFKSPPPPRVLFETHESIEYVDVAPDGKRFLLNLLPQESAPIHVIVNGLPSPR